LTTFTAKAYKAVGRDSTKKQIGIQVANMWQASPDDSPEARSIVKRRAIETELLKKLRGSVTEPTKTARSSTGTASKSIGLPALDALNLLALNEAEGYSSDSSCAPRKRGRIDDVTPDTVTSSKRRKIDETVVLDSGTPIDEVVVSDLGATKRSSEEPPAPITRSLMIFPPHPLPTIKRTLMLPSLLDGAFSVVIRPLYPIPKPPKGRPALKTIFPPGSLLSTLDALLVGVEWIPRTYPFWKTIVRGLVFVDEENKAGIVSRLEERKKELINAGKNATEIMVISSTYLSIYIDSGLQETGVELLWHSHPHLQKGRENA
jgi:hypothetical protein